jgi:hypothetical protein
MHQTCIYARAIPPQSLDKYRWFVPLPIITSFGWLLLWIFTARINFTASLPVLVSCPPSKRVSIPLFIPRCTWSTFDPSFLASRFSSDSSHYAFQCYPASASALLLAPHHCLSMLHHYSYLSATPLFQCCPCPLRSSCFGDVLRQ